MFRRVREHAAHLAGVVRDGHAVAMHVIPEVLHAELRAEREACTADERASDHDEKTRRMVERETRAHGVVRRERARGGRAVRGERPAAVGDRDGAERSARRLSEEHEREVARASGVREEVLRQRDAVGIDRFHVEDSPGEHAFRAATAENLHSAS